MPAENESWYCSICLRNGGGSSGLKRGYSEIERPNFLGDV